MPRRTLILVVEDEAAIADVIRMNLERAGYAVRIERDGTQALQVIRDQRPAAVVLDIGVPGTDGIEVCRSLRSHGDQTPVLFVTARDDEVDRIVGLELGADDYVTKPFSPRELVARVGTVLRRARRPEDPHEPLRVGAVTVDPQQRRVYLGEDEISLTVTEFALLAYLMQRPGQVFAREQLLSDVWGHTTVSGTRTVDVHIAQLRGKLGEGNPIRTVRGVGYSVDDRAR